MTTCPNCDAEVADDAEFCSECGRSLMAFDRSGGASAADLIGRTLFGEYKVVKQLGVGGMGAVYLAEQESIDQNIAVKVLHPDSANREETVERFHREAKAISMLSHPNIVRVLVFGRTEDDLLLLAMEYVEGTELREQVGLSPMDELRAIKILEQACSAVAEAHDFGIIHRDLKPENLLLTTFRGERDFLKILDFGIAKIRSPDDREQTDLTEAGTVHGTPDFISPEQAKAEELDGRSDIYALGCILYEMVTGRLPFEGDTAVDILEAKVYEDPPPPGTFASVAPRMDEIIMGAIARDRDDRYDDALEMYDDLVLRERQLLSDADTEPDAAYVPGAELTGLHRSLDRKDVADEAASSKPDADRPDPELAPPRSAGKDSSDGPSLALVGVVLVLGTGVIVLAVLFGYLLAS